MDKKKEISFVKEHSRELYLKEYNLQVNFHSEDSLLGSEFDGISEFLIIEPEINPPQYTLRLLLKEMIATNGDVFNPPKKYAHVTLGCFNQNHKDYILANKHKLTDSFNTIFSSSYAYFYPLRVINLDTKSSPLWGVECNLGKCAKELTYLLHKVLDENISHEKNRQLYQWRPGLTYERHILQLKCEKTPHITIGRDPASKLIAEKIVKQHYKLIFDKIDYKKIGPYDPEISFSLNTLKHSQSKNTNSTFSAYNRSDSKKDDIKISAPILQ